MAQGAHGGEFLYAELGADAYGPDCHRVPMIVPFTRFKAGFRDNRQRNDGLAREAKRRSPGFIFNHRQKKSGLAFRKNRQPA